MRADGVRLSIPRSPVILGTERGARTLWNYWTSLAAMPPRSLGMDNRFGGRGQNAVIALITSE